MQSEPLSIYTYFILTFSMEGSLQTALVAIAGMITLLGIILGLEKMIRIIMGNYLIASIILGLSNLIDLVSGHLLIGATTGRRVDDIQQSVASVLSAGKPTLLLTVYFILLIFITTKSHLGIGKVKHELFRWVFFVIFLPCTVISMMLTMALAIYGNQIMDLEKLALLAKQFEMYPWLYNFIMLTPLWIVLPGLVTFAIAAFVLRTKDEIVSKIVEIHNDDTH